MTYLVGINLHGVSAILAENRASYSREQLDGNTVVKVGVLYPGVTYGIAGRSKPAYRLLEAILARLPSQNDLAQRWERLLHVVRTHEWERDEPFDVVLATRHSGVSELHHVHASGKGQLTRRPAGDLITFGGGKAVFDDLVERHRQDALSMMDELYPYAFSLRLTVGLWGLNKENRAPRGVGGHFVFVRQAGNSEWCQGKSLLVFGHVGPELWDNEKLEGVVLGFARGVLCVNCREYKHVMAASLTEANGGVLDHRGALEAFVRERLRYIGMCMYLPDGKPFFVDQHEPITQPLFEVKETITTDLRWLMRAATTEFGSRTLGTYVNAVLTGAPVQALAKEAIERADEKHRAGA